MAINSRLVNKVPKWADRDSAGGVKFDTATFVGIVKNNLDPSRAGRLQVFIPDLGGNEDDPSSWKTVNYASPFFGVTYNPTGGKNNSFADSPQTYGMWMVPPDLGNQVLITFANGDPDRGYWFACVYSGVVGHYMVPGLAAGNNVDNNQTAADVQNAITKDVSAVPVTEFNEEIEGSVTSNFYNNAKPVHEEQFKRFLQQGLDKDRTRGAVTSSSQRESPSSVFGINTPGRFPDAVQNAFIAKVEAGTITEADLPTGARRGGHSFVMDDGDIDGIDNLVRLRSSSGHQILMNDDKKVMYIINSEGSVWLEFSENGHMHVYASGGLNIRSEGDLNLHSDKNININAEEKLNITGVNELNVETNKYTARSFGKTTIFGAGVEIGSSADLSLYADTKGSFQTGGALALVGDKIYLNSGGGAVVAEPKKLSTYVHADTSRAGPNTPWQAVNNSLDSLCSVVPSHEPWKRSTGVNRETGEAAGFEGTGAVPGPNSIDGGSAPTKTIGAVVCEPKGAAVKDSSGKTVTDGNGNPVRSSVAEEDPGPKIAKSQTVTKPCPREWLSRPDVPNPPGAIGPLSQYQVKCLMAQIAFSESRWNYELREATNGNYLGRYQVGAGALTDLKYMKLEYTQKYSTAAVRYPDAWLGTDKINSDTDFLAAKGIQEAAMYALLKLNYETLIKKIDGKQGIVPEDDLCTVAGMLSVAHLLGPAGARRWRYSAVGGDANGTTGATYYNRGRYAIDVLANGGSLAPGSGQPTPIVRVDASGMTPAAKAAAQKNLNPDDYIRFTNAGTGSGSRERFLATQEVFRAMILGAAEEYKKATGEKLNCNSSLRTAEDQEKLYNAWREAGGKYPKEGGPATVNTPKFGQLSIPTQGGRTGQHGQGLAIDLEPRQVQKMISLGLVEKYGLQFLGPVDPPHLQVPRRRG